MERWTQEHLSDPVVAAFVEKLQQLFGIDDGGDGTGGGDASDDGSCEFFKQLPTNSRGRWGQSVRQYRHEYDADNDDFISEEALDCTDPAADLAVDCAELESLERFAQRGWVVLRGLAPPDEVARNMFTQYIARDARGMEVQPIRLFSRCARS